MNHILYGSWCIALNEAIGHIVFLQLPGLESQHLAFLYGVCNVLHVTVWVFSGGKYL